MKKLFFALVATLLIAVLTNTACKHEPPDVYFPIDTTGNGGNGSATGFDSSGWKCSADTAYFVNDVLPIFSSKCATSGCHDAITREDGYQLTDYANVMRKGIRAGNAANSTIFRSLTGSNGIDLMPPPSSGITLTQAEKELIGKWINQGALNNQCNANYGQCDTTAAKNKFTAYIMPLVNKHCNGCHSSAATGGNILLRNYAEVKASVNTGAFYGSIAWASGFSRMPKSTNQLSACDVSKINAWIKRGAPND